MSETKKELKENFKKFVTSAGKTAEEIGNDLVKTAEKIVAEAKVFKRQTVVSVRLDDDSVHRIEQLLEAGVCHTRSEAVSYLTREGIKAREDLFRKIDEKIGEIQRIREDLRKEAE
jgi:Arc/MetJ-type ribon-helix-helix transcriptional regulator